MKLSKIGLLIGAALTFTLAVGCTAESTEPQQQDEKQQVEELPAIETKIETAATCPPIATCAKACGSCTGPSNSPSCKTCAACLTCGH